MLSHATSTALAKRAGVNSLILSCSLPVPAASHCEDAVTAKELFGIEESKTFLPAARHAVHVQKRRRLHRSSHSHASIGQPPHSLISRKSVRPIPSGGERRRIRVGSCVSVGSCPETCYYGVFRRNPTVTRTERAVDGRSATRRTTTVDGRSARCPVHPWNCIGGTGSTPISCHGRSR